MIDYAGPAGKDEATNLFESGSILLYLAEKYGKFLPTDPAERVQCVNWLFCQVFCSCILSYIISSPLSFADGVSELLAL